MNWFLHLVLFQHHLLKRVFFFTELNLYLCWKWVLYTCVGLLFYCFIVSCVIVSMSYSLFYCLFRVSLCQCHTLWLLELYVVKPNTAGFPALCFFRVALTVVGCFDEWFAFIWILKSTYQISIENHTWILTVIVLNLLD